MTLFLLVRVPGGGLVRALAGPGGVVDLHLVAPSLAGDVPALARTVLALDRRDEHVHGRRVIICEPEVDVAGVTPRVSVEEGDHEVELGRPILDLLERTLGSHTASPFEDLL